MGQQNKGRTGGRHTMQWRPDRSLNNKHRTALIFSTELDYAFDTQAGPSLRQVLVATS